jgi:LacI family transcriptional regulator
MMVARIFRLEVSYESGAVKRQRVNHKDVANRAGVSVATVSYVINNGPRPVSLEARQKVEAAVAELGYYPNEVARSLRLQQSSTIGVVIPRFTNPVYGEIVRDLESVCSEAGFLVLLCNSEREQAREQKFVQMLRAKHVDGVVITPDHDPLELIGPLLKARIPVVVLEHDLPGVNCIAIDELAGGRMATQHLLDLGHRRIAMLKHAPTSALSSQRLIGYQKALEAAGITFDPKLVLECEGNHRGGELAMRELLKLEHPPTAVFAHNDVLAIGAYHAIREAGLSVPEDISVVGYDDITSAAYLAPPLTTVHSPKAEMGALAGQTILRLMAQAEDFPPSTVTLPVQLLVRGSTSSPKSVSRTGRSGKSK